MASTKKGNRPSYIQAAQPVIAKNLYEKFLHHFEKEFDIDLFFDDLDEILTIADAVQYIEKKLQNDLKSTNEF
jgi:hypothetical protein